MHLFKCHCCQKLEYVYTLLSLLGVWKTQLFHSFCFKGFPNADFISVFVSLFIEAFSAILNSREVFKSMNLDFDN